ncbi:MAG: PD-(D/E)XK nuclease superfamily protein [Candidatus Argoarchaeum ethanivorans]|uniref:PD-(D/E)XK nuclease superfamily protein n=1 Tax=Candidatus Argoarchaeum ethanivorans TaxID=2608793 RepID=A0A811ZZT5_9EURY|nr:MAG: PD-(D/E)XK nuclease superfamily protein [Candidatus Argoarchaeum ethanivorans]
MNKNKLSSEVIKAAISLHKELGPGLLESVYQSCMVIELSEMGIDVQTESPELLMSHQADRFSILPSQRIEKIL